MKGKLIGEGNTAEVYAWGEKDILKLFHADFPYEAVEKEYHISKVIEELGLSIPKAINMIEFEDRRGIIYQRITGESLLGIIFKSPLTCAKYAKHLAKLHYQIHQCVSLDIPKYKETLEWNIRHSDLLNEEKKLVILNLLEKLPEGNALCHGDFHPGNVMKNGENYYILDWMTAAVGSPAADVARTMLLLRDSALPEYIPAPMKLVIQIVRRTIASNYLKNYMALSGIQREEIDQWRIVIAAARLFEWTPDIERQSLLKEIEKVIG